MKSALVKTTLLIIALVFVASCGYRNPNVYSGPDKLLYMASWKNRTNELRLDAKIHQNLIRWFQKADKISIIQKKNGADLILAGEIISIDLPSLSYGADNDATEVKVILTVKYILKDIKTGQVLVEVPQEVWTEGYLVSTSSSVTADNESKALAIIIDDMSANIYRRTLQEIPRTQ